MVIFSGDVVVIGWIKGKFIQQSIIILTFLFRLHMIELLNTLQIDFAVLGNHEFDHGTPNLLALLPLANFKTFGSNIRHHGGEQDGLLLQGLTDLTLIPLSNGLHMGLFGVSTIETMSDGFAGVSVTFEDEIAHARRCVATLRAQGADVIVALTHMKVDIDQQLARHVPEIDLILGGHDHEPMTNFVGTTMIHKSGQDALWLGQVEMEIVKEGIKPRDIRYNWEMRLNQGYPPHTKCAEIIKAYADRIQNEWMDQGKLIGLATSWTVLDGTKATCRTRSCNLGNLIADALRIEMGADIGLIPAAIIKGDRLHPEGLVITPLWLEKTLPLQHTVVVLHLSVQSLREKLLCMLAQYPAMCADTPQLSGLHIRYDNLQSTMSIRLSSQPNEELKLDQKLTVATTSKLFSDQPLKIGPIVRNIVAQYLQRQSEIAYKRDEQRWVVGKL